MARWSRIFRCAARTMRAVGRRPQRALSLFCCAAPVLWLGVNWGYQVARQPAELPGLFGGALVKTPRDTWESYEIHFRAHSTAIMTPAFLAALAHAESGGSPLARPEWRWRWSWNPFAVYAPASSATGMYQITDGTFAEARRYCILRNRVVETGPWHDLDGCWFNWAYSRLVPGHAVELTAAYLDVAVRGLLAEHGRRRATLEQKQTVAAVVHLCGRHRAATVVRRGFHLGAGERCGSHHVRDYVRRVRGLQQLFARAAASDRRAHVALRG